MASILVRLSDGLKTRVAEYAAARGLSFAAAVRLILTEAMDRAEPHHVEGPAD